MQRGGEYCIWGDRYRLSAPPEQIGRRWRRFEWTFRTPAWIGRQAQFRVFTRSSSPVEVRDVSLRASHWAKPVGMGSIPAGARVYEKVAELPPRRRGDRPVAVYENRLWRCGRHAPGGGWTHQQIEALKWAPPGGEELAALSPPRLAPEASFGGAAVWPAVAIPLAVVLFAVARVALNAARGGAKRGLLFRGRFR
jgi:hypothetical protein